MTTSYTHMIWDTTHDDRFKKGFSPLENRFERRRKNPLDEELKACGEYAMTRSIAQIGAMRLQRRAIAMAGNSLAVGSAKLKPEAKLRSEQDPKPEAAPATHSTGVQFPSFIISACHKMAYLISCLVSLDIFNFVPVLFSPFPAPISTENSDCADDTVIDTDKNQHAEPKIRLK